MLTVAMTMLMMAPIEWETPDAATRRVADPPFFDGERDYTFMVSITIPKVSTDEAALKEASKEAFDKAADTFCGSYSESMSNAEIRILGYGREKDGSGNVTLSRLYDCVDYYG